MLTRHPKDSLSRMVTRLAGGTLVVTITGLSLAQSALAQDVTASVAPGSSSNPGLVEDEAARPPGDRRADELVSAAGDLVAAQSWAQAASTYEQAAALRASSDIRAVDELWEASNLYAFAQDHRRAVQLLERAGERAAEMDEVLRAAKSFQQAAVLNAKIGGVRYKTTALWEKVCELSESPRLTDSQRDGLLRRVPTCR